MPHGALIKFKQEHLQIPKPHAPGNKYNIAPNTLADILADERANKQCAKKTTIAEMEMALRLHYKNDSNYLQQLDEIKDSVTTPLFNQAIIADFDSLENKHVLLEQVRAQNTATSQQL